MIYSIFLPFVLLPGALAASNVPRQIQARALSTAAPGPWAAQGCYTDKIAERTLPDAKYRNANMSIDMCIAFCGALDFPYAGVEYRIECYCGNTLNPIGALENPADCNAQCPGNAGQACGADYRLQVYLNVPPVPPSTPASIGKDSRWKSAGCYTDSVSARTFPNGTSIIGGMTAEKCTSTCQANGFTYAECWCGNTLGSATQASGCDMPCSGNATQICGGGNRLTVYQDHPPTPISQAPAPLATTCVSKTTTTDFELTAIYHDGAPSVKLSAIDVSTDLAIFTKYTNGNSTFNSLDLVHGEFHARHASVGPPVAVSPGLAAGQALTLSYASHTETFSGFCTLAGPADALFLATEQGSFWALCPNSAAGGREDVVWAPVPDHPLYVFKACCAVYLLVQYCDEEAPEDVSPAHD